jgi:hypothetical protein
MSGPVQGVSVMYHVARLMGSARTLLRCGAPLALLAILPASPAGAIVTETVSISNTYGSLFNGKVAPTPIPGGSVEQIYRGRAIPGAQSELGINYTATADAGGFFFLHDNYCVGTCSTFSQTVITFTLTNIGESTELLRFDSEITPGHLARIFNEPSMSASFAFDVLQVSGEESALLYSASGSVGSESITLDTGGLDYNGLTRTSGDFFEVVDWGTTNLSVGLNRLLPGQTTQVVYRATYMSSVNAICPDIFACPGVQVVFGDPRNNGGVTQIGQFGALAEPMTSAVIGAVYDPSFVRAEFVQFDAPLPPQPERFIPAPYGDLFDPRVIGVPEPASWALMILGFGAAGGAVRRRRARLQVA